MWWKFTDYCQFLVFRCVTIYPLCTVLSFSLMCNKFFFAWLSIVHRYSAVELSDNSIVPFSSLHEPWQSHQTAGGGNKRKLNQLKDVKLIENQFFVEETRSPPTTDGIVVMFISEEPQKLTVELQEPFGGDCPFVYNLERSIGLCLN